MTPATATPLRAGDRDRAQAAERLSAHAAAGRLTAACLAAAVLATVLVGHPIAPPLIAAVLLWRAALRPHRPTGRLLP
jgi:hypothetical protein